MPEKRSFYEATEFPFLAPFAANWAEIRDEVLASRERAVIFPDPQGNILAPGSSWQKFELHAWGLPVRKNVALLPGTRKLLGEVPRLMQAAVYILGPKSHITPHEGYTDRVLRTHVGLRCPDGCSLRVGSEVREERDGRILVFDDTNEHEAWNRHETDERLVLHLDFVKPELPYGEKWFKELRLLIARQFSQMIPIVVAAGVDVDPEIRADFLSGRLPLPRRDAAGLTSEQWSDFDAWLAAG